MYLTKSRGYWQNCQCCETCRGLFIVYWVGIGRILGQIGGLCHRSVVQHCIDVPDRPCMPAAIMPACAIVDPHTRASKSIAAFCWRLMTPFYHSPASLDLSCNWRLARKEPCSCGISGILWLLCRRWLAVVIFQKVIPQFSFSMWRSRSRSGTDRRLKCGLFLPSGHFSWLVQKLGYSCPCFWTAVQFPSMPRGQELEMLVLLEAVCHSDVSRVAIHAITQIGMCKWELKLAYQKDNESLLKSPASKVMSASN